MTDRQRAFIGAFLSDPKHNATRAAASAGYSWPGKQGPRLRHMAKVAAVIGPALKRERAEHAAHWDAEREARRKAEMVERQRRTPAYVQGPYKRRRRRRLCT